MNVKKDWICPICSNTRWKYKFKNLWQKTIFPTKKLLICANCKCGSMHPMPTLKELNEINSSYWSKYTSKLSLNFKIAEKQALSRIKYLNNFTSFISKKKILDIGSGYGYFLDALLHINKDVKDYDVIESDKNLYRILYSKGVKNIFSDIDEVFDKNYSLVIMSHILEHLPNPENYLKKVKECMRPNGILFIEVPNQDYLYLNDLGLHLLSFNPPALHSFFKKLNFQILNISTAGYPIEQLIPKNNIISKTRLKVSKILALKMLNFFKEVLETNSKLKFSNMKNSSNIFFKNFFKNPKNPLIINSTHLNHYGGLSKFIRMIIKNKT